jgi:hypothetical protein
LLSISRSVEYYQQASVRCCGEELFAPSTSFPLRPSAKSQNKFTKNLPRRTGITPAA